MTSLPCLPKASASSLLSSFICAMSAPAKDFSPALRTIRGCIAEVHRVERGIEIGEHLSILSALSAFSRSMMR